MEPKTEEKSSFDKFREEWLEMLRSRSHDGEEEDIDDDDADCFCD